jgi:hypothetical protein
VTILQLQLDDEQRVVYVTMQQHTVLAGSGAAVLQLARSLSTLTEVCVNAAAIAAAVTAAATAVIAAAVAAVSTACCIQPSAGDIAVHAGDCTSRVCVTHSTTHCTTV